MGTSRYREILRTYISTLHSMCSAILGDRKIFFCTVPGNTRRAETNTKDSRKLASGGGFETCKAGKIHPNSQVARSPFHTKHAASDSAGMQCHSMQTWRDQAMWSRLKQTTGRRTRRPGFPY